MKFIFKVFVVFLPWPLKRLLLNKFFKYDLHPKAKIGLAYVYPRFLKMKEGARIGHFTFGLNLDNITIGYKSTIGRSNWITGFPTNTNSKHFAHQKKRASSLILGKHSAITKKHHLDCTNTIAIGDFVTVAGYASQFLTHSINIELGIQDSKPISIGNFSFVGTNTVILGGASLPEYSVLGAKSLLNKSFENSYQLFAGVPAKAVKKLDNNYKYFNRKQGFIY